MAVDVNLKGAVVPVADVDKAKAFSAAALRAL